MLTVRDLNFFSVGRLSSTSISFTMLSSWVRCLFSLDVFGSFSSISVSANIKLVYYYFDCLIISILINLIDSNSQECQQMSKKLLYTSVSILLGMKEVFLVIFVFSVAFFSIFAFWFWCHFPLTLCDYPLWFYMKLTGRFIPCRFASLHLSLTRPRKCKQKLSRLFIPF